MNLADLKSFAQVVQHGGFTAAERATGEPKAKLSRRVARLEADLDARLLERSTRNLRVTDVGREIFQQCELIAASIEATHDIAARSRSTVSGALRISCPPGLARYLGTDLLSSFVRRYPEVNLEFHLSSHRVDLIRERFDAAFRVEVDDNHDQLFVMRQLGRMERILVAAPALMHQLPPVTIEALATSPILSMGEHVERDRWALIHTDGRQHVVTLHPQLVSNDSVVIREAAVDGLGIALLPVLTCAAEIARGGLVQVLPEWHAPEGSIHLIFTAKKGMSNTLRAFIDHVVGAFSNSVRQVRA